MIDRRKILPQAASAHGYTWNGRRLVAVTTVIGTVLRAPELEEWFKRMGGQADRIRDEAAAFGKSVHAGLKAHLTGARLLPLDMPEAWTLAIEAAKRWLDANLEEVYAVEEPIASRKYGYAGTPDLYGLRVGKKTPAIIDYKTSPQLYWSHRFQTAAYRRAAVETYEDKPAERIVLLLSKDEPGRVTPQILSNHDADFAGFGYCLGLYGVMQQGVNS
jgi:hypothetical protein